MTAVSVLAGGVLAILVTSATATVQPISLTYQGVSLALAGVPCLVVLLVPQDVSDRVFEWTVLVLTGVIVTAMTTTIWFAPSSETPLAFLALGLVASAYLLRPGAAAVALVLSVGAAAVGLVVVGDRGPGALWTLAATAGVGIVAHVAVGAQRRALTRESRARAEAVDATAAIEAVLEAAAASSSFDQEEVIRAVVDATRTLGCSASAVRLFDDDGRLAYAATTGLPPELTSDPRPPGEGLAGEVLRRGRAVVLEDYPGFSGALASHVAQGVRSAVGIPLSLPDGGVLGVLLVAKSEAEPWSPAVIGAIELLADHAARALQVSRDVVADRELLAALQLLHHQQADFVATVSHELRTPLTVIEGMTATLLARGEEVDDDLRRQLLERIAANTTVLGSIIEALLDAARLDGGLTVSTSEVSLLDLAADAVGRLAALSQDHELRLDGDSPGVVLADRELLDRVFENLLSNAVRHTPAGTSVVVTVEQRGGRAHVAVSDDGPGVPSELLPRLTDRFVRGGELHTRATRGLGIGLSLVAEVLQLHGTRLEIYSPRGGGATFCFSLPLASHPEARTRSIPARRAAAATDLLDVTVDLTDVDAPERSRR